MKQTILMVAIMCATLFSKAQETIDVYLIGRPAINLVNHSLEVKNGGTHPLGSYYGKPGSRELYQVTKEYSKKGISLVEDLLIVSTKHLYFGLGTNVSLLSMRIYRKVERNASPVDEETAGGYYFTTAPRITAGIKLSDIALKLFVEREYQMTRIDLPDNNIIGLTLAYKGITATYATREANYFTIKTLWTQPSPRKVHIFGLGYRF